MTYNIQQFFLVLIKKLFAFCLKIQAHERFGV